MVEAIINLTVSLVLVHFIGIYGVLLGTIIGSLFRTPVLIWYSNKKIIERNTFAYYKKILLWLPIFVGSFLLSEYKPIHCNTLLEWIGVAALALLVIFIIFIIWMLIVDRKTLKSMVAKIKNLKKKKAQKS